MEIFRGALESLTPARLRELLRILTQDRAKRVQNAS